MEIKPAKPNRLTLYIGIALVAGIIAGFILNKNYVGTENTKIANAEVQAKHLHEKMRPYEIVKDSAAFNALMVLQKNIALQKRKAESGLLVTEDETGAFANIKLWSDSLKTVNGQLALLTDTGNVAYKQLLKQRELIAIQKNDNLKERDKKLDWFTILADIFLGS